MNDEKTQKTPRGEEIPIPKRGDFLKALKRIVQKPTEDEDSTTSRPEQ